MNQPEGMLQAQQMCGKVILEEGWRIYVIHGAGSGIERQCDVVHGARSGNRKDDVVYVCTLVTGDVWLERFYYRQ